MKHYRVELETPEGVKLPSVYRFKDLQRAEFFLKNHSWLECYARNIIPDNKRYGTIWEDHSKGRVIID
jgi:hypothetical protein